MAEAPENPLAKFDAKVDDKIKFVADFIAANGLTPGPPEQSFPGRIKCVERVMEEYHLDEPTADGLVKLAQNAIWGRELEVPSHVVRRMAVMRLMLIRESIAEALREPRETITEKKVDVLDEKGNVRAWKWDKKERVQKTGLDPVMVELLIKVEDMIQKTELGGAASDSEEMVMKIFGRLDQDVDGAKKTLSVSKRIKNARVSDLPQSARDIIKRAFDQKKQVESKEVINAPEGERLHEPPGREAPPV